MPCVDGPASPLMTPLPIKGNVSFDRLASAHVSRQMLDAAGHAPRGRCVCWGIDFNVNRPLLIQRDPVQVNCRPFAASWLVFMHTADLMPPDGDSLVPFHGRNNRLGQKLARYVLLYQDGTTHSQVIRQRFQINPFWRNWGPNCFQAVGHVKPRSLRSGRMQTIPIDAWGPSQIRVSQVDDGPWMNWLWAWQNPCPRKKIVGIRFEPIAGTVIVSAVSMGNLRSTPLRWQRRSKALLTLDPMDAQEMDEATWVDDNGLFRHVQIDMGQIIAMTPQAIYPDKDWPRTHNNDVPKISDRTFLVEYAAHPQATLRIGRKTVPVAKLDSARPARAPKAVGAIVPVAPSHLPVTIKAIDSKTRRPIPVKLHLHGQAGEYLAPEDRHRYPNACWIQDLGSDFSHQGIHHCTYMDGQTQVRLPLGRVFLEASRGFEVRPVRKAFRVTPGTREIVVELEKVLPWRERNWVSADTHVHFISPGSLLLEGRAEGVNVVNLLATRWGELVTNVGDFDGATTLGARETGGDGEYLVRVGTENRQHVLGHISLLGYDGRCILPMTTAGGDESAMGDAVDCLLTDWARACRKQRGIVVASHFPNPPAEHAATLVNGDIDAVEMTSWGNHYAGIDPYSLTDWYRFLNCGYMTAAVGGTDKMATTTAVGTIRTYAHLDDSEEFTYDRWKQAIRDGRTFVTYGPLMEFAVEGKPAGSRLAIPAGGGTVDVTWKLASATVPMTRVELIVNGRIVRSQAVDPAAAAGHWAVKIDASSWAAIMVRGQYRGQAEMIAAHSSPVRIDVRRSELFVGEEAVTILDQIEGSLAFLDTIGTRSTATNYRRMRLTLTHARRALHNRMHQAGVFHEHTEKMK